MKRHLFNYILLFLLIIFVFIGNIYVTNQNLFFVLIYSFIILYHITIFFLLIKSGSLNKKETYYFLITSILLYFITYFIIYDPNPFLILFFYYIFKPCLIKAFLIIIIHFSFLFKYMHYYRKNIMNYTKRNFPIKYILIFVSYQFFDCIIIIKKKITFTSFLLGLILFFCLNVFLFLNRIKLWVYFNNKNKTLPHSHSKNVTFYIASNVVNIENIINIYISEMKKLINYLGENNVIVSIIENGDSEDNTRKYLENFQSYLNEKNILNKFILTREIEDPRMNYKSFLKLSPLRIEYYAKLRNKCLDFLYEIKNIDFENMIVIFFNDIVFSYEDIINLLSTNNEDFDAVCGLDMNNHLFYDTWVSVDLDGKGLRRFFPFFLNKEGQDLVTYHKPIRVFSCWNGVIAFKALPLKNKRIQFRHKINLTLPHNKINSTIDNYFESECTYFHIDMHSLGYTKRFINPDVRVSYQKEGYFQFKYYIPSFKHLLGYFLIYYSYFFNKRNKYMSNYFSKEIKIKSILENWYLENKIDIK